MSQLFPDKPNGDASSPNLFAKSESIVASKRSNKGDGPDFARFAAGARPGPRPPALPADRPGQTACRAGTYRPGGVPRRYDQTFLILRGTEIVAGNVLRVRVCGCRRRFPCRCHQTQKDAPVRRCMPKRTRRATPHAKRCCCSRGWFSACARAAAACRARRPPAPA